ncbi:hypothetical protein Tco_0438779 [Tanacetum coccineum]
MEEHRASMEAYKKVHNETVRSELRMEIVQQSMEMDMWEIKEKLAERREQMAIRAYEEDKRREEWIQKIEEDKRREEWIQKIEEDKRREEWNQKIEESTQLLFSWTMSGRILHRFSPPYPSATSESVTRAPLKPISLTSFSISRYGILNEDCDDGSRKEEHVVVPCSDEEIVKSPTQPATTEKSSEDGGNLEELILTSAVDKGKFTGPILAVKEDLGQKLIDDLDEPLIVLESYGMINKNKFANGDVAPVAAVAPVEQSSLPLGRIKQNIIKPVPAQRRTWDLETTQYNVLKQHLEDKVFLRAGVLI